MFPSIADLRQKFRDGKYTFFFDLPAADEREAIWQIYTSKYGVQAERPHDDNWTGPEIKECCRKAYRFRMSLRQSAEYTVPVARWAADQIESLRQQSSGKHLSASHPGIYEYNRNASNAERASVPDTRTGMRATNRERACRNIQKLLQPSATSLTWWRQLTELGYKAEIHADGAALVGG